MSLSGTQLHLVSNLEEAMEFKRWLGERHENDVISIDLETTGFNPYDPGAAIRLIQFGDTRQGWAMSWLDWRGLALEALTEFEGIQAYHNVQFEYKWLSAHSPYKIPRSRTVDTMIGAHIINPLGSGALKQLSTKYVDDKASAGQNILAEAFAKNGWDWATVPTTFEPYWTYGALDPVLTAQLWDKFKGKLTGVGPYKDVFDLEMAVRFVVSGMEQRGARVNLNYSQEMFDKLSQDADLAADWAKKSFGINIASNTQLAEALIKNGGELFDFTDKGQPKVDKYTLKVLSDPDNGYPYPVQMLAGQALRVRRNRKFASTYFKNFVAKNVDGYVHADIRTLGARTGRMSVGQPALQQLPKGNALVRNAFIPRDGNVLVTTDYSQIEMRLMAEASGDPGLQEAFRIADATGGDFFVEMGKIVYNEPGFVKSDKRRGLLKNCVPLSSQILTKRGWLNYDEVKVGDETIGYDFTTGRSRWTEVNAVSVFDDPDDLTAVYRLAHSNREFFCTDNHRWIADNGRSGDRGRSARFVTAAEVPGSENRLILAAPAEDGDLPITPDEAALLGWVLGDGGIKRGVFVGAPSQGRDGQRVKLDVTITQTKPSGIATITSLLDRIGTWSRVDVTKATGQHTWHLDSEYCRDLLSRAGIEDKQSFDPWTLASGLTHDARVAMADAIDEADGKSRNPEAGWVRFNVVQKAGTPVADLCVALGFLLGKYAKIRTVEPDGRGWQRQTASIIDHQRPTMTGQRASMEYVEHTAVWCVSTELGSWTMRQKNDQIPIITGNTFYGKAYGAGPAKMAESAGVPVARMEAVVNTVDERFPGLKGFMSTIESKGAERKIKEGEAYVITPIGRRLPADEGKTYTLVNYLLQSWAADVLKKALVRLDAAGYDNFMILPVHDEIVMDIPAEYAEQALRDVPIIMQELDHAIPLTADSEGPLAAWGQKYL